jgi:hypothetical protein
MEDFMGMLLIQKCRRGLSLLLFGGQWDFTEAKQSGQIMTCGF